MATNVGVGSVSYGIGVQNRYSAFLDDESGFNSPNSIAAIARKRADNVSGKQKATSLQNNTTKSNGNPLAGKANARVAQKNKLQDHQKSGNQTEQKRGPLDGKRQRANATVGQQHQSANNSVQAPRQTMINNRPQGNNNQDNTANNNIRSSRNHQNSNYHHQSNVSHNQTNVPSNNNNKENHEFGQNQGKYVQRNSNGNQRVRRQYHNDDKKNVVQHLEDGPSGSFIGTQSNEEEKRRRQQKRALDLKHKDPEKREARRQQVAPNDPSTNSSSNQADLAQSELNGLKNGQRNRRKVGDGIRNADDVARPSYRPAQGVGIARGKGRREPGVSGEMNGERRDVQQAPRGDRPQRNRNGFGSGSRGSRGSRGEDHGKFGRDSERQKPIPNISDKFDFPSLAS